MVKIKLKTSYQFSTFYNFTHQHQPSNLKCVHRKDTLTGDGSAVGQCGAAAGLLRLASNLRDPVLRLVSGCRLGKFIFSKFCLLIDSQPDKTEKPTTAILEKKEVPKKIFASHNHNHHH